MLLDVPSFDIVMTDDNSKNAQVNLGVLTPHLNSACDGVHSPASGCVCCRRLCRDVL